MKARITNIVIDVIAVQNQNKNSKPMDPDHQTFFCNVGTAVLCYIIDYFFSCLNIICPLDIIIVRLMKPSSLIQL